MKPFTEMTVSFVVVLCCFSKLLVVIDVCDLSKYCYMYVQ